LRLYYIIALITLISACATTDKKPQGAEPPAPNLKTTYTPRDLTPAVLKTEDVLVRGATIWTVTGETIVGGDVLVRDGKIAAVSATPLALPDGVRLIDARGRHLTPGLIDSHSHLGVYPTPYVAAHDDGNEATSPTTPDVEARHSVWPQDPGFQRALAGGITALQILPGSANLIGGRAATLQLVPAKSARAMMFPGAPGGVKMACGENPKRVYGDRGGKPSTRMGNMAVWRQTFIRASEQRVAQDRFLAAHKLWRDARGPAKDEPQPPSRDLGVETLVGILRGELLVHVHCYRADEIVQVMELADEFGFKVRSFHHATEAYKVRDALVAHGASASVWADWWGFKMEAQDAIPQNAALLAAAGGRAIIHSDSEIGIQRLNQEASKAYWSGRHVGLDLTERDALAWITINPAWSLGIDAVTGSIEVGKRADLVIWDKHPLSVYASAELVFVAGSLAWDRAAASKAEPQSDLELQALPSRISPAPAEVKP
jgi:imidazolonepropionase-like amidohydrolase